MGGIVLTNDGNAILREIDVNHPAGKFPLSTTKKKKEKQLFNTFGS